MAEPTRVERVLRLVRLLIQRGHTLEELTARLGITERTLFRDVAVLRACGYEVTQTEGAYALSLLSLQKKAPPGRGRTGKRAAAGRGRTAQA